MVRMFCEKRNVLPQKCHRHLHHSIRMHNSFRQNWRVRLIRNRAGHEASGKICSASECKIHIIIFGISILFMLFYLLIILPKRHIPKLFKKSIVEENIVPTQRCAHLAHCSHRGDCLGTDDPLFPPVCRCFFLWTGKNCHQFGKLFYILTSVSAGSAIVLLVGAVIIIRVIRRPKRRLMVQILNDV